MFLEAVSRWLPRQPSPCSNCQAAADRTQSTPASTAPEPVSTDAEPVSTDAEPVWWSGPVKLLEHHTPVEHAERFWDWLRENGYVGGSLLAADMIILHREMCRELGWMARPWNPIGCALRLRTTGRKKYVWDRPRRLRVYALPPDPTLAS